MKQFEESNRLIGQKFEQYTVQPPASVWSGIEQSLDQPLKVPVWYRSKVLLFSSVLVLVIAAFTGFYFYAKSHTASSHQQSNDEPIANQANPMTALESQNSVISQENREISIQATASSNAGAEGSLYSDAQQAISADHGAAHSESAPVEINLTGSSKNATGKKANPALRGGPLPNTTHRNKQSRSQVSMQQLDAYKQFAVTGKPRKNGDDYRAVVSRDYDAGSSNPATVKSYPEAWFTFNASTEGPAATNAVTSNTKTAAQTKDQGINETASQSQAGLVTRQKVSVLNMLPSKSPSITYAASEKRRGTNLGCFSFAKKNKPNFFGSLHAGAGTPFRHLEAKNGNESTAALAAREQTEKTWYSISAGAELGLRMHNSMVLKVGAQFSQIREKFDYLKENAVVTNGNDDPIIGVRIVKTTNRYTFIDIPLSVGYVARKGRFGWHAYAGVAYTLSFQAEGIALTAAGRPEKFSEPGHSVAFVSNAGLSAQLQAGLDYYLGNRLNLFVRPQFQARLKDLSTEQNPISHRYQQLQIQMGLSCFF